MIVGIDLGTTNSLIAVWDKGSVKIIPNALGKYLTPSIVSVDEDKIIVGEPALNRLVTHSHLSVANFKRLMGSNKITQLGTLSFRPEELSALILKSLKEDAESFLGCTITEAVISVPAYFSDAQRKATKVAGKLAGLHVERLINEPTAAGISYALHEQVDETNYLIFDLGGGTFDVTILTMFCGIVEVRASSGDNFLGGIDFTSILEEMFVDYLKTHKNFKDKEFTLALEQKIHEQAEIVKHKLSLECDARMQVHWQGILYELDISIKDFESKVEPLLQRLTASVKRVLNDAKLSSKEINQVILVGGATRMSVVKKLVTRMFGKLPSCHIDPDSVVVQGTAIQAGLKANDQYLEELVVTDVSPYSLGIAVSNSGVMSFDPLIERNTVIPTSRSFTYYPCSVDQQSINVQIYQGENFYIEKNIFLGNLEFKLPKKLKNPAIDIRFSYDINGLLEVEATITETQEKHKIVIEGNPGILTEQQIAESLEVLKALKTHPRDATENILLLSTAERLYEDLQGEHRLMLAATMKAFILALEEQEPRRILKMHEDLRQMITAIRSELALT